MDVKYAKHVYILIKPLEVRLPPNGLSDLNYHNLNRKPVLRLRMAILYCRRCLREHKGHIAIN